VLLEKIKITL